MRSSQRILLACLAGVLSSFSLSAYTPTEDGIYAVFDTSSGEIVARLFYLRVPVMVGNFMRLASYEEGDVRIMTDTVDAVTGTIQQKPFYEGTSFHRVAAPFGIVGGAPAGRSQGGPGYFLPNEVFFPLRDYNIADENAVFLPYSFQGPGRLAMLDTSFNANGSQFFITTEPESIETDPVLFGKHSVFGELVEGMDVVRAIEAAPRDGEVPLDPVPIHGIAFVRKGEPGSSAQTFNPQQPTPGSEIPRMEEFSTDFRWKDASTFDLAYSWEPWSYHYFFTSPDLEDWKNVAVSRINSGPATEARETYAWDDVTAPGQLFFRGVRARGMTSLSSQFEGRTLQVLSAGQDPIRFEFEENFTGRYRIFHSANATEYTGAIAAWRAWLTGSSIQVVIQFSTLVVPVPTGDDTFLVTQPQQIYLYFNGAGEPLATFTHVLGIDDLPAANLPGVWEIRDTAAE